MNIFQKFWKEMRAFLALFTSTEKKKLVIVLCGLVVNGFFDIVGVGSVVPFLAVVGNPSIIHTNSYLRWVYDFVGTKTDNDFILLLGLSVVGFLVATSAIRAWLYYFTVRFAKKRYFSMSYRLFRHYLFQPYLFFLRKNSADLLKRFTEEIAVCFDQVFDPVLDIVSKGVVVVGLIALVFYSQPFMALLVALVLGGLYSGLFSILRRPLTRMGKESHDYYTNRMKLMTESFSGIKDLKFFHKEARNLSQFEESSLRESINAAKRDIMGNLPKFLMEAIAFGGIVGVVLFLIMTGAKLGTLLPMLGLYAFAGYRLLPYFQQIFINLSKIRFSFVRLKAIVGAFQEGETVLDRASDYDGKPFVFEKEVRVSHLSFRYPGSEHWVLKNIELCLKSKTTTGIVGSSGAGKSTFVDLILGLLPVEENPLSVDDLRLTSTDMVAWRKLIGYVPQNIFLLDSSVGENIAFGESLEELDWQRLEKAARMANIHDFISRELIDGYKTTIGERGVRLSGGQRQRIGIARALYTDPRFLILDEATSSLDNESEEIVMEAIRGLGGSLTILIIAHRLSTLKSCDQIFRLKDQGLELVGAYQDLVH